MTGKVEEYLGEITQYNLIPSDCIEKDSQIRPALSLNLKARKISCSSCLSKGSLLIYERPFCRFHYYRLIWKFMLSGDEYWVFIFSNTTNLEVSHCPIFQSHLMLRFHYNELYFSREPNKDWLGKKRHIENWVEPGRMRLLFCFGNWHK